VGPQLDQESPGQRGVGAGRGRRTAAIASTATVMGSRSRRVGRGRVAAVPRRRDETVRLRTRARTWRLRSYAQASTAARTSWSR
jgi:hypothetical protein